MVRFQPLQVPIGETFNQWTVLRVGEVKKSGQSWYCVCSCGTLRNVSSADLRLGRSRSCFSCRSMAPNPSAPKDGSRTKVSRQFPSKGCSEFIIYKGMKKRCFNPRDKKYKDYGGRGITVCDRWRHSWVAFREDMGPRPSNAHSIDRYPDNDGNYEPGNCRWATASEQQRNKRRRSREPITGSNV